MAALTAGVPVGGMGCSERRDVAVGGDSGDGIDAVGLTRGEASGERGVSSFLCVRQIRNIADIPTASPNAMKKRILRLTCFSFCRRFDRLCFTQKTETRLQRDYITLSDYWLPSLMKL